MIKEADIYNCIEQNKAPHIRLYNVQQQLLHIYDDGESVQNAIDHLKTILPMFRGYGKVIVNCATPAMKTRKWAGSYYMTCVFDNAAAATINGPQQFSPWAMPPGYVSNEVMMAKLETLQKEMQWSREIDALKRAATEKDKEDPAKQVEKFFPYALYAMGKPIEEIQKVTAAIRIGNANLAATGSTGITSSLTFKDVEAKPTEEKAKQFEGLARSIEKKVSIEEMILLYDAIDKDPTLVQTALQALPLLKKN